MSPGGAGPNKLVEADGLTITFHTPRGETAAVTDISFNVGRERLGVVGESGAGKSTLGRALLGLLPETARIDARRFSFQGADLLTMPASGRRALRGRRMAMILQDPRHALNPVMTVGTQIAETLKRHAGLGAKESRARGRALLASVRIADPERVWRAYAHELSGGLAQRAMIAMMLAPGPELLIADEATSALDVMAREQVLAVLAEQQRARGMGVLMISHDLGLVARFCDRVLVMRQGRVVEEATGRALAAGNATDPYTRHLLAVQPRLEIVGASGPPNRESHPHPNPPPSRGRA